MNGEMILTLRDFTKVKTLFRNSELFENLKTRKKIVRQIRKEFRFTSRRVKKRGPNSHMPFKILSFSLFQFNVSLKLDLSLEFFQQIDHYPFFTTFPVLQWKSAKTALRKQLFLPLKGKRKWNTIPIFQYQIGCDNCRVIILKLCFLGRSEIKCFSTKGLEHSPRGNQDHLHQILKPSW